MSLTLICKELSENQNVTKALEILKELSSKNELKPIYYLKVFHCLYKLVLKRNEEKEQHDFNDVYDLTVVCCRNLFNNKAGDIKRYDVMLRLYHIHKYLFRFDPLLSRAISEFFINIDDKLNREENLILDNLIFDYSKHIIDIVPDKIIDGEWFTTFLKLFRLQSTRLSRLFRNMSTILSKANHNVKLYMKLAEHFWKILINFFDRKFTPGPTDYVDFLQFLDLSIAFSKEFVYEIKFDVVFECINRFEKCSGCDPRGFAVLKKFIDLFTLHDINIASLRSLLEEDHQAEDYAIFSISNFLFYKYTLQSNKIEPKDGIKICLSFANIMSNRHPKKPSNDFTILVQTINTYVSEPSSIVFDDLRSIFKSYLNDIHENSHNAIHWTCHMTWVYFKNNLYTESGDLSLILLNFILKQKELSSSTEALIKNTFLKYLSDSLAASKRSPLAQMALISMAVVHKNLETAAFDSLAKLKSSESSEVEFSCTAAEIVVKFGATMQKEFFPFQIENVDFDHLLFLEAKSYASVGGAQKAAVISLCKAAQKVKNLKIYSSIMICLTDAITSKSLLSSLDEFEKYLTACVPRLEKNLKNSDHNLLLGSIYYQLVKCELFKLRMKTESEVVNFATLNKTKRITRADQPDELDDTSFTPACTYLQFNIHAPLFEKLDKAFFHWKSSLPKIEMNEMTKLALSHIEAIGYLYRLYKFKEKEFTAWKLLYEFGDKIDSLEHKTLAIASILEIKSSVGEKIKAMKKYFEENELKNSHLKNLFYLNLAKNAYLNNQVEHSQEILKEIDVNSFKNKHLISIQYNILLALVDYTSEVRVAKIFIEFRKILHLIKFGKYQSFGEACNLQCVFFDTAILLSRIFSRATNVRYARSFLKEELAVAQKLALPLRVCDFLIELGFTDMDCWNTSECDFKIKIVQYVLNLKEIDFKFNVNQRPSSPTLKEKLRLQPHFLSLPACSCIYCSNTDYKIEALNIVTLSALNLLSKSSGTMEIFQLGKKIIEYLETKTNQFLMPLNEYKIAFYKVMSLANLKMQNLEKATEYNSLLSDLSNSSGSSKMSALVLKNHILWLQSYKKIKNTKLNKKSRVSSNFCDVKTPEKPILPKKTPILKEKFAVSNIEVCTPQVKCRALLFESDDEGDSEITKSFKKLEITPKVKSSKKRMTSAQVYCDGSTPESAPHFAVPTSTAMKKTRGTTSKISAPKTPSIKTPRRKQLFNSDDESDDFVEKSKPKTYSKQTKDTPQMTPQKVKKSTLTPSNSEKTEFATPNQRKSKNQETPREERLTRSRAKFRF